jgi:hypothetical protein
MQRDSDEFIENIRGSLALWKQEQLKEAIHEDQDTTKLNQYVKMTALAYDMLKGYVSSNGKNRVDPALATILQAIGSLDTLSRDERMLLQEYLFRDLIEYPFTYNTRLINGFQKRNAVNTNFVPNQ